MSTQSNTRYGAVAQALHWLTAILVLVAFVYGLGGTEQRVYAPSRDFERQLHESLGLCVLVVTALRLLWRRIDIRPRPTAGARWMDAAASTVQALLYLLLLAVPLTAIVGAWLEGHPLTLLGGAGIPSPFGVSHAAGALLARIHPWLADAIMWVAGLHAAAALFHQFVLKDEVLGKMLPRGLLPARRTED